MVNSNSEMTLTFDNKMNHKSKTLQEIKGDDKTVFTYDVLQEMREGKINSNHPLFDILHNVGDILLTEAFEAFSVFMSKLKTDSKSVQDPDNVVRRVYEGFKKGMPQRWKLIEPDELLSCIQHYSCPKAQSDANDDYWVAKIMDWVANAKDNIAQLAANSYLCASGGRALLKETCRPSQRWLKMSKRLQRGHRLSQKNRQRKNNATTY